MGGFVLYILEWALSLLVLLFVWKLAFAGTTLHCFNRIYLLAATLASALIPLAGIETSQTQSLAIESTQFANVLQQVDISAIATADGADQTQTITRNHIWAWVLAAVYAAYIAVLIAGWTRSVFRMIRFLKGRSYYKLGRGIRLYKIEGDMGPFSWMNCIVISRNENGFARHAGLLHELSHVRLCHQVDLIFLLICTILNPVCWLVLGEIRIIHEFEADACVIGSHDIQSKDYQKLLIMRTAGAEAYALASSFESNIKKRIIMIKKEKTLKRRMLYLIAVIPAIAFLLMACGTQKQVKTASPVTTEQNSAVGPDQAFVVVEDKPEFLGGAGALLDYLRRNIRYPAEAHKKNVQGRIVVQFIVEKDGSITDAHVADDMKHYIKSNPLMVDKLLADEAVRVISSMPAWKPGTQRGVPVRVQYAVPINFRLEEGTDNSNEMIIVAWKTNPDGQKEVGYMLAGKNSATPDVQFVNESKIKSNVKKISKTDSGIFFIENDKDTNLQLDAVQKALGSQKNLNVTLVK